MKNPSKILVAGIVGPVVAIILTFIDTLISPWFSWGQNALSDLGVHPYSYLFNLSLIFEGAMNLFLAVGLMYVFGIRKATVSLLVISGLSLAMVGIFVETYHPYHLIFALIYFLLFPVSILLVGIQIQKKHRAISISGYFFAIASLITIIIGILIDFGSISISNVGLAIPEMIEAVLLGVWSISISVYGMNISAVKNNPKSASPK